MSFLSWKLIIRNMTMDDFAYRIILAIGIGVMIFVLLMSEDDEISIEELKNMLSALRELADKYG